ncbi:2-hydroxyacid dehydrogenase [Ostreibacterium oceani]|uniref:Glyoxylate/hydroxypyruvate reductase A n=1 Tax=Ostreibacterium oceani TaxID=2654998 RepID=A0A6N7EZ38_9GAMM|nr:glyoxylate/hydroxypyruvate reductase A [Ostreibacterium oceani]MPV86805.1 glyoxylate/hydroxypyruvate reductase A [Ostreibacterium oceani]
MPATMPTKKYIMIYHPDNHYLTGFVSQLQSALPNHQVSKWSAGMAVDYLLAWQPNASVMQTPNLSVLFSLGAGVDALLRQAKDLDLSVPIVRLVDAGMGAQMFEMALYATLVYSRDFQRLANAQQQKRWLDILSLKRLPFTTPIGILGLGALGGFVASKMAALGYSVSGYSRDKKVISGVTCYCGDALSELLNRSEVLINLLPLTPQTQGILNKQLMAQLPRGAFLVNLARGEHLVEDDLLWALDNGVLSGALLDVFQVEPLPVTHPFWTDERIIITPHIAALTQQDDAVAQIVNNIHAFEAGQPMTGVVDREAGY